jgi:hypothetical protein
MKRLGTLLAAMFLACAAAAEPVATIGGAVEKPQVLTLAMTKALPVTTVSWTYNTTRHGVKTGVFRGVLLWTLLEAAGVKDDSGKDPHVRRTILVTGRDGYAAVLALAEIDPVYEGKSVLLADEKDGKPLDGFALVVPGDREGGRGVHEVTRIEVQ